MVAVSQKAPPRDPADGSRAAAEPRLPGRSRAHRADRQRRSRARARRTRSSEWRSATGYAVSTGTYRGRAVGKACRARVATSRGPHTRWGPKVWRRVVKLDEVGRGCGRRAMGDIRQPAVAPRGERAVYVDPRRWCPSKLHHETPAGLHRHPARRLRVVKALPVVRYPGLTPAGIAECRLPGRRAGPTPEGSG
jgi:hypothetical protein